MHHGEAMGTGGIHAIGFSRRATIEREILAHDPDRTRLPRRQILRAIDRLPEAAQIFAARRAAADARQLLVTVGLMSPGTEVKVEYLRDGKSKTVAIKLAKRTDSKEDKENGAPEKSDEGVLNGVTVGDITAQFRSQLRIPARIKGAIITEIDPDSPSAKQGLREGDVILELNQQPVPSCTCCRRLKLGFESEYRR